MNQQDELARLIDRHATEDGIHQTQIPRLSLICTSHPTEPLHVLHEPALCIVAQGRKRVLLGDEVYLYGRDQYLVVSVDLAVSGQVVEAEPEKPYRCFRLDLDATMLTELLTEAGLRAATGRHPGPGLTPGPAAPELLDGAIRLLRLLTGERAHKLRQIALADGRLQQVNPAISWIKTHYREPFRVELVASEARMGPRRCTTTSRP